MTDDEANGGPTAGAPTRKRRRTPIGQSIGGVLFGFEQQVWRTRPPAEEMVHHARPDDPVPAKDGGRIVIGLPEETTVPSDEPPVELAVERAVEPSAELADERAVESSAEPADDTHGGPAR